MHAVSREPTCVPESCEWTIAYAHLPGPSVVPARKDHRCPDGFTASTAGTMRSDVVRARRRSSLSVDVAVDRRDRVVELAAAW